MALVLEDSNRRPATVLPSRIIAFSFRSVVRSAMCEQEHRTEFCELRTERKSMRGSARRARYPPTYAIVAYCTGLYELLVSRDRRCPTPSVS